MTASDDSGFRLIGVRPDGYLDYYDEATTPFFENPNRSTTAASPVLFLQSGCKTRI